MTRTTTAAMYLTDYTVTASPSSQTVARGGSATDQFRLSSADNWVWQQNFSILSGFPNRVTPTFNPTSGTGSTLTLAVANNALAGTNNIVVQVVGPIRLNTPK